MRSIAVLSLGNFFSAAYFFLIIFILAPYLATLLPAAVVGLAIALGAIVTLVIFPFLPGLVRRFGPQKISIALALIEIMLLLGLATGPGALLAVIFSAFAMALAPFSAYQLDLMLEAVVTDEGSAGRIRTLFLSFAGIALVLAPLVAGLLLGETNRYWLVFLAAALVLVPFVFIMARHDLPLPAPPKRTNLRDACLCVLADRDLRAVMLGYLTLQLFFHLAPLYIPLYLHIELGIPWSELGWMFAVMLIPFVVLEYPAGWLADTNLGDKRILAAGFVITGISFAALGLVTISTPLFAILAVLVLSRVGAALVEAMTEGHFFRRVSSEDANTVSLFRMLRPTGALLAPIVGGLLLAVADYSALFAITGLIILLFGLVSARGIRDSRPGAHISPVAAPPFPPHGAPRARA